MTTWNDYLGRDYLDERITYPVMSVSGVCELSPSSLARTLICKDFDQLSLSFIPLVYFYVLRQTFSSYVTL